MKTRLSSRQQKDTNFALDRQTHFVTNQKSSFTDKTSSDLISCCNLYINTVICATVQNMLVERTYCSRCLSQHLILTNFCGNLGIEENIPGGNGGTKKKKKYICRFI